MCDQRRPFALVVPRMAASSPMLLKAILAHSSHHISRVTDSNHSLPLQYHEECLGLLIPKLRKDDYFKDESIVLATIFLRSFGEFEGEFMQPFDILAKINKVIQISKLGSAISPELLFSSRLEGMTY